MGMEEVLRVRPMHFQTRAVQEVQSCDHKKPTFQTLQTAISPTGHSLAEFWALYYSTMDYGANTKPVLIILWSWSPEVI